MTIAFLCEGFIFLKSFSLKQTFRRLEKVITENESIAQFFPLFTLLIQILFLAHIFGLLYHSVADIQIQWLEEKNTWLQTTGFIDKEWTHRYIHCLYWAICTMVTILLYIPETNIETVFAITSIFVMCGVFGYALNLIGVIVIEINQKQNKHKSQRQRLNRFFKKRQINPMLRERIALYLEFKIQQELEKNQEEEDSILHSLSNQLQKEVKTEINHHNTSKFLKLLQHFSEETKQETLQIMIEEQYSGGETITDNISGSLYAIVQGSVSVEYQKQKNQKKTQIDQVEKGQLLGLVTFFTNQKQDIKVKSLETCTILKIQYQDFLSIIQQNKDDYERFSMIKDELLNYRSSKHISQICEICEEDGHIFQHCDKIQFKVDQKQLIYDYNNLDIQLRMQFGRIIDKTFSARFKFTENQAAQEELFEEDNPDDETYEICLWWQNFYELNIPKNEGDTNSQVNRMYSQHSMRKSQKKLSVKQSTQISNFEEQDSSYQSQLSNLEEQKIKNINKMKQSKDTQNQKRRSSIQGLMSIGTKPNNNSIIVSEFQEANKEDDQQQYQQLYSIQENDISLDTNQNNYMHSFTNGSKLTRAQLREQNSNQMQLSQLDVGLQPRPRVKSNISFMSSYQQQTTNENNSIFIPNDKQSQYSKRRKSLQSQTTFNNSKFFDKQMSTKNNFQSGHELEVIEIPKPKMQDTWDLLFFDKPKNYLIYFPHNNLEVLIEEKQILSEHSEKSKSKDDIQEKYKKYIQVGNNQSQFNQGRSPTYLSPQGKSQRKINSKQDSELKNAIQLNSTSTIQISQQDIKGQRQSQNTSKLQNSQPINTIQGYKNMLKQPSQSPKFNNNQQLNLQQLSTNSQIHDNPKFSQNQFKEK